MSYILQNAIHLYHNGNNVKLLSRYDNMPQKYKINDYMEISIDGGKRKFIGNYESVGDIVVKDLRITYDTPIDEIKKRLLWCSPINVDGNFIMQWVYAKELKTEKIKRIIEDSPNLNPLILKTLNLIRNEK